MDCRHFRKQHTYFVDDMLSGVATWEMRGHLATCRTCSRFDAQLRRALHAARRAPMLEPSRDFKRKLSARLAAERLARPVGRPELYFDAQSDSRPRMIARAVAASFAAVAVGVGGILAASGTDPLVHTPAVPMSSAVPVAPTLTPALFATMSSGLSSGSAMVGAQRLTEEQAAIQSRASEKPAQ
jgi:hypothetical protein